jgi:tRNA pseudouridine55 synthase
MELIHGAGQLPTDFVTGSALLIDKPAQWTSFDVVNKLRFAIRKRHELRKIKVGHAGTLDPMATGLLILCTGAATKQIDDFQGMPKVYEGTLRLGATTPSYDAETPVDAEFPTEHITPELLEQARLQFLGPIAQVPPMYSAIKMDGQPLYKKARQGVEVERKARDVEITAFEFTRIALPDIDFRVHCSKGTYIRSLAHDLGQACQSGAYLTRLVRTHIGPHALENAWALDELIQAIQATE